MLGSAPHVFLYYFAVRSSEKRSVGTFVIPSTPVCNHKGCSVDPHAHMHNKSIQRQVTGDSAVTACGMCVVPPHRRW
eukprot:m.318370 g.318370  ORF g.318370 m.318370 type:complete len:77 (-) comp20289_c0_seq3:2509-2739(-)